MITTFLITALLVAAVKFVLFYEVIGAENMIRFRKLISVTFAVVLPLLFAGTLTGMMTAMTAGIFLSAGLALMAVFVKPQPVKFDFTTITSRFGKSATA